MKGPAVYTNYRDQHSQEAFLDAYIQSNFVEYWVNRYINKISFIFIGIVMMSTFVCTMNEVFEIYTPENRRQRLIQNIYLDIMLLSVMGLLRFHARMVVLAIPIFIIGLMNILANIMILTDTYLFDEYLICGFTCQFLVISVVPTQWKVSPIASVLGELYVAVNVYALYDNIPPSFMVSIVFSKIFFVLSNYVLDLRFRELYKTIIDNENLLKQNRKLMEAFPDGVVVETKDAQMSQKVLFSNNKFNHQIRDIRNQIQKLEDVSVKLNCIENNHKVNFESSLQQFLSQQQRKIDWDPLLVQEQLGVSIEWPRKQDSVAGIHKEEDKNVESADNWEDNSQDDYETKVFNIKTLEVIWDNIPWYMHVFIDTTDLTKLEEANDSIRCQKIMFTSVSHELRTPLNGIINFYQLIEQRFKIVWDKVEVLNLHDQLGISYSWTLIKKFLKLGSFASLQLLALIEDILDLSKFESGIFVPNINDFIVKNLIEEVMAIFEHQWVQKKIKLRSIIDESLNFIIAKSDSACIKQVLLNLVSNSFKYSNSGSAISICVWQKNKFLKFRVRDTGIGIKYEDQNKLFQLFSMLPKDAGISPNGWGIGLTVSKKWIEALGGSIELTSEFGKGTNVTFSIPLKVSFSSKMLKNDKSRKWDDGWYQHKGQKHSRILSNTY